MRLRSIQRRDRNRHGATLIYVTVIMVALIAFVSFGVDLGRVQLAKTQLQQAADAAARYAVTGISDDSCLSKAQSVASANACDGTPIVLQAGDVESGAWSNGTFIPGGDSPNAVRVTARRTVARGNAISLYFARIVGISQCDAHAVSVATIATSDGNYAFAGVDDVNVSGNAQVDSYDSSNGPYSQATRHAHGDIATNGSIALNGNVKIYGNAYYKAGFSTSGNARIVPPGQALILPGTLSYPAPTLPDSYVNMGSLHGAGNGQMTLSSGNYYFTSINTSGNYTLHIDGQVNVYVSGDVSLSGNFSIANNLPENFKLYMLNSNSVNVSGNANFYADVYGPNSTINISGNGDIYGRMLGKSINASGNGNFHYDESLARGSPGSTQIATVQ